VERINNLGISECSYTHFAEFEPCHHLQTGPRGHVPSSRSSRSSSSHPLFLTTLTLSKLPVPVSLSCSVRLASILFSWSSVTFCCNCPDLASMMSRFSTSVARDSFTIRIRPSRSAASGSRIWARIVERASDSCFLPVLPQHAANVRTRCLCPPSLLFFATSIVPARASTLLSQLRQSRGSDLLVDQV
jgi:hypothetical protein